MQEVYVGLEGTYITNEDKFQSSDFGNITNFSKNRVQLYQNTNPIFKSMQDDVILNKSTDLFFLKFKIYYKKYDYVIKFTKKMKNDSEKSVSAYEKLYNSMILQFIYDTTIAGINNMSSIPITILFESVTMNCVDYFYH